jgi:hypothetical protein
MVLEKSLRYCVFKWSCCPWPITPVSSYHFNTCHYVQLTDVRPAGRLQSCNPLLTSAHVALKSQEPKFYLPAWQQCNCTRTNIKLMKMTQVWRCCNIAQFPKQLHREGEFLNTKLYYHNATCLFYILIFHVYFNKWVCHLTSLSWLLTLRYDTEMSTRHNVRFLQFDPILLLGSESNKVLFVRNC